MVTHSEGEHGLDYTEHVSVLTFKATATATVLLLNYNPSTIWTTSKVVNSDFYVKKNCI